MEPAQKRFMNICEKLLEEFFLIGDEYMLLVVMVLIEATKLGRQEDATKLLSIVKNYVYEREADNATNSVNDILSSEFLFPEGE